MNEEELIEYCLSYPGVYKDYPFDETWTVMRHVGNKKSFAFIFQRHGHLCVNLKCDPIKADFLRTLYTDVQPGYHMNKEHWNTVNLEGEIPLEEIQDMIEHSYHLTQPKIRKKKSQD